MTALQTNDLKAELASIPTLPRSELVERWIEAYGRPPPKGLSRRLLVYAAAYHAQVKRFGGLKPETVKKLQAIAREDRQRRDAQKSGTAKPKARAGTRFARDWHGRTHVVDVEENGRVVYDGKVYRSLSEVARAITGARWSGPRFFGL